MNKNKHDELMGRLKAAQDEIRIVKESLAAEAEATPEPVIPWEPKSGRFYVGLSGVLDSLNTNHGYRALHTVGRTFQTEEAATRASEFFIFYQRLYKLALECNAKHFDLGYFTASYRTSERDWVVYTRQNETQQTPCDLFTSRLAAQEACDIMNRDGWELSTSPKS